MNIIQRLTYTGKNLVPEFKTVPLHGNDAYAVRNLQRVSEGYYIADLPGAHLFAKHQLVYLDSFEEGDLIWTPRVADVRVANEVLYIRTFLSIDGTPEEWHGTMDIHLVFN